MCTSQPIYIENRHFWRIGLAFPGLKVCKEVVLTLSNTTASNGSWGFDVLHTRKKETILGHEIFIDKTSIKCLHNESIKSNEKERKGIAKKMHLRQKQNLQRSRVDRAYIQHQPKIMKTNKNFFFCDKTVTPKSCRLICFQKVILCVMDATFCSWKAF